MRHLAEAIGLAATIGAVLLLSACAVVSTAASVTGTVVSTTVGVAGDVVGTASRTVTGGSDDEE